jgi:hypothetical protein
VLHIWVGVTGSLWPPSSYNLTQHYSNEILKVRIVLWQLMNATCVKNVHCNLWIFLICTSLQTLTATIMIFQLSLNWVLPTPNIITEQHSTPFCVMMHFREVSTYTVSHSLDVNSNLDTLITKVYITCGDTDSNCSSVHCLENQTGWRCCMAVCSMCMSCLYSFISMLYNNI